MTSTYLEALEKVDNQFDNITKLLYEGLWRLSFDENVKIYLAQRFDHNSRFKAFYFRLQTSHGSSSSSSSSSSSVYLQGLLFQLGLSSFFKKEEEEDGGDHPASREKMLSAKEDRKTILDNLIKSEADFVQELKEMELYKEHLKTFKEKAFIEVQLFLLFHTL